MFSIADYPGKRYEMQLYLPAFCDTITNCGGKSMVKISVLLISIPLMIAAIVFMLFADRIDMAVNGDRKVKKVIVTFGVGVLLICTFAIAVSILA
jgi:hypothetical protein